MTISLERLTKLYIIINLCFHLCTSYNFSNYLPKKKIPLRIYKGTPVQLGEVPYMVALKAKLKDDQYFTFCGGTLVGETKVLTAAHCFVGESTGILTLCFRRTTQQPLTDKYAVAATLRNYARKQRIEEHEQWRSLRNITYPAHYKFPNHDVAILFVKRPFNLNDYVKPIPYASRYRDYEGICVASGYGRISNDIQSDSLLKGYLVLISGLWCSRYHGREMSHTICTSVAGSDIGKGDSGGPLVCTRTGDPLEKNSSRGILVGIATGTLEGVSSVFARVSHYRQFIERNRCLKSPRFRYSVFNTFILSQIIFFLFGFDLFEFFLQIASDSTVHWNSLQNESDLALWLNNIIFSKEMLQQILIQEIQ